MKPLVIYAHPKTNGHCSTILGEVKKYFKSHKIKYDLIDLYAEKYDALLHEKEHYTAGGYSVSKRNKEIQKMILATDKLIFIYPVWWGSMPAVLKGFIDRVFVGRFAFKFRGKIPVGLLKGKKALVFLTTGSASWIYKLIMSNRAVKLIKNDILGFCGVKAKVCQIGGCTKLTDAQKIKIQKVVPLRLRSFLK
ncbi:NAD(P)H-dependent oxidoreductase [Candidatus Woesearchaeota archaeon]|jgi:NAD(P)H dehydrogenase (quinone)|nr:NAD(P)H-dependent oxidoreductase [Candidatus Woesearchaeota archaeon]MBT3537152.1 NAD(P)H-dependent oxidoreductase [Candidatus Woesearchaeota archaeon]MBT4697721.1 NAD(P)H-dependent oxidoreductase [Candidatus Woesearchaeota archaeon]MBT4716575.1 NAD(P)H-dependent oxidoreductase [Candidatus Woesearchaeota archaeon]MBT7106538.1 NAD(P)H-dependent oxidoreductase [Candidatus Woesearchaeota archaeon]